MTMAEMEAYFQEFLDGAGKNGGVNLNDRYASFDYCFNYFQSFRDRKNELVSAEHLQQSCLQLGFYLASWGMLRGSTGQLQKSMRHLVPTIELIAATDDQVWQIDIDQYNEENIERLLKLSRQIKMAIQVDGSATDTLSTKVMLGVFGNVPAFDTRFKQGFGSSTLGKKSLRGIAAFYDQHQPFSDRRIQTMAFDTQTPSDLYYPKAKLLDMVFFIKGGK